MDKTPLQQMIDLWEGIAKLHNDAMFDPPVKPNEHHTFAKDFRQQNALRDEANTILRALRIYAADLEDGQ
jgi:hypothetical protein